MYKQTVLTDEYVPVNFTSEDFDEESYPVYEMATMLKNFRFYTKKGERDRYYLELLESGLVAEIEGGIVNLENGLRVYIDELGTIRVTEHDIREAFVEEGVYLEGRITKQEYEVGQKACVNVKALYLKYGEYIKYGNIEMEESDYNLYNTYGELVCVDGEWSVIEEVSERLLKLRNDEGELPVYFYLTREEADVGIFRKYNNERKI